MNYRTYSLKSGVVINDAWLTQLSEGAQAQASRVTTPAEAYARVPLVFKALRLRANALVRVPRKWFVNGKEVEAWPYEDILPFKRALWQTEAGRLWSGAGYWLRLRNRYRYDKGMQVLNPSTMKVNYADGVFSFTQNIPGQSARTWSDDEIYYWREWHPTDEINPGISAAAVGLGNAQIMHYLSRFASAFFESGAMPILALGLPDTASPTEVERVENWFKKVASGVRNAWRAIGVKGEIKPTVITPSFKDMALPDVRNQGIESVADAFEIPETILRGNSASYATATQDWYNFITTTIAPRASEYEDGVNEFLAEQRSTQGVTVKFLPDELPEMQEDEEERAGAFSQYVNAGVPMGIAMNMLGGKIAEEDQAAWDELCRMELERKKNPPEPPVMVADDEDEESDVAEELRTELRRWHRRTRNDYRRGKAVTKTFLSDSIPDDVRARIMQGLESVKSEADIAELFTKGWRNGN